MAPSLLLIGERSLGKRFITEAFSYNNAVLSQPQTTFPLLSGDEVRIIQFDPKLSRPSLISRLLPNNEPIFTLFLIAQGEEQGDLREADGLSPEERMAISRGFLADDEVLMEITSAWSDCINEARSHWPATFDCTEVSAAILVYGAPELQTVHWTDLPTPLSDFIGNELPIREFIVNDPQRAVTLINEFPWKGESRAGMNEIRCAIAGTHEEPDEGESAQSHSEGESSSLLGSDSDDFDIEHAIAVVSRVTHASKQLEGLSFRERAARAGEIILGLEQALQ